MDKGSRFDIHSFVCAIKIISASIVKNYNDQKLFYSDEKGEYEVYIVEEGNDMTIKSMGWIKQR